MFTNTDTGLAPGQDRLRSHIQAATRVLISIANHAQAYSGKADDMDDTGPTEVLQAQAIVKAQNTLVKRILNACRNGPTPEAVIDHAIESVLKDAVVSDLAWNALGQALARAVDMFSQSTGRVPSETKHSGLCV